MDEARNLRLTLNSSHNDSKQPTGSDVDAGSLTSLSAKHCLPLETSHLDTLTTATSWNSSLWSPSRTPSSHSDGFSSDSDDLSVIEIDSRSQTSSSISDYRFGKESLLSNDVIANEDSARQVYAPTQPTAIRHPSSEYVSVVFTDPSQTSLSSSLISSISLTVDLDMLSTPTRTSRPLPESRSETPSSVGSSPSLSSLDLSVHPVAYEDEKKSHSLCWLARNNISTILISPLRRALQTASLIFDVESQKKSCTFPKCEIVPDLRESVFSRADCECVVLFFFHVRDHFLPRIRRCCEAVQQKKTTEWPEVCNCNRSITFLWRTVWQLHFEGNV
jgi:hypothetical protein